MNLKEVFKGVKHLVSSNLIVQLINVLTIPILSRLYSPHYWGEYSFYLAIFLILAPLSCLSLGGAIILTDRKDEQYKISVIASYIAIFLTFLLAISILFLKVISFQDIELNYYFILLPLLLMFHEVLLSWLTKHGNFKAIALILAFSALINVLVAISSKMYSQITFNGLIAGHLAMYLIQIMLFYYCVIKVDSNPFFRFYSLPVLYKTFIKYKDFPLFKTPQTFFASVSQGLPVLIFNKLGFIEASGKYGMARKLVGMPSQLIGKALTRVYFKELSDSINKKKKIRRSLLKSSAAIAVVTLPVFIIIIFYGSDIFSFILGKEWEKAGDYAALLSFWLYFALINKPATAAIAPLKLQKEFFIYELALMAFRFSSIIIPIHIYNDLNLAVMCFSLVGMFFNAFLFLFIILKVRKYECN
ncbi:oligosaccharide flippase family protein [Pseudoalteromonas simplex]|uniref:oligosaccharide flippase family protein n=1 Tax=Pseudoalteromonas simplex TaxID=2783613 RepID=UPI0018872D81|nr:oligosaccharide flippase family protein [Pseudoalteromonas sp. A520]